MFHDPVQDAQAAQGGLPPELAALLGGGGGAGLPGGAPPEQPPEMDPIEHLRQAIQHAQAALVAEPDDMDSQSLAKVVQGLYSILANRQKEQEQLLGGGNLRGLARSYGNQAA